MPAPNFIKAYFFSTGISQINTSNLKCLWLMTWCPSLGIGSHVEYFRMPPVEYYWTQWCSLLFYFPLTITENLHIEFMRSQEVATMQVLVWTLHKGFCLGNAPCPFPPFPSFHNSTALITRLVNMKLGNLLPTNVFMLQWDNIDHNGVLISCHDLLKSFDTWKVCWLCS